MESVNKILRDKMIKHQVGLLRLSSAITAKLVTLLNKTEDDILSQLSTRLENTRLNAVLAGVRDTLDAAGSDQYEMLTKELTGLANYEPEFVKTLLQGQIPVEYKAKDGSKFLIQHDTFIDRDGNLRHRFEALPPGAPRGVSAGGLDLSIDGKRMSSIGVRGDLRHKGIGTALLTKAEQDLGYNLEEQWAMTDDGEALWKSFQKLKAANQLPDLRSPISMNFNMVTPSTDMLASVVTAQPFQGKLLKEWVEDLSDSRRKMIRDAVRMGMVEGQTVDQIARRIRGTRALQYKDGLMEISRRGAQAMVRTAVNHTASRSRQLTFEKNQDIIGSEQYVATLDGRTTPLCRALDGKVYPVGKAPVPGRDTHIGCRSCLVPVVKSWRGLGFDIDEAPEGVRASFDGQVPESTTYNEWLKGQDAKFQDSVLGPGRGELFRQGASVDKFVDIKTGRNFTLKELTEMDL